MKNIVIITTFLMASLSFAQNKNAKISFEVDGVCMMCKDRIEKACIKTKGVKSAIWDVNTHQLSLIYNEKKTNLEAIKSNILAAGHDLSDQKAPDVAYDALHPCCKYRDEEVLDDHKKEEEKE